MMHVMLGDGVELGQFKWTYDGLCADADLFGVVMKLDGPPTWRMRKFTKEYFLGVFGSISSSARFVSQRGEKLRRYLPNF